MAGFAYDSAATNLFILRPMVARNIAWREAVRKAQRPSSCRRILLHVSSLEQISG